MKSPHWTCSRARGQFRPCGYRARITATRVKTADPLEIYEDMEALVDAVNASKDHPISKLRIPRDVREHPSIHGTATDEPGDRF